MSHVDAIRPVSEGVETPLQSPAFPAVVDREVAVRDELEALLSLVEEVTEVAAVVPDETDQPEVEAGIQRLLQLAA